MHPVVFLFLCIGTRLSLTFFAKSGEYVKELQILTALISIGFLTIYLFDLRKTGVEAGGPIWWNSLRPIHGALYGAFALSSYYGLENAWMLLLLDTIIGILAFFALRPIIL